MKLLTKTLLLALAVAVWILCGLLILRYLPIEVLPAWTVLSAAGFTIYLIHEGRHDHE